MALNEQQKKIALAACYDARQHGGDDYDCALAAVAAVLEAAAPAPAGGEAQLQALIDSEPSRQEGKHRFLGGTCVDCGKPLDKVCAANLNLAAQQPNVPHGAQGEETVVRMCKAFDYTIIARPNKDTLMLRMENAKRIVRLLNRYPATEKGV